MGAKTYLSDGELIALLFCRTLVGFYYVVIVLG